eukprot:1813933-Lingulodinium_polyedra.AAC.1
MQIPQPRQVWNCRWFAFRVLTKSGDQSHVTTGQSLSWNGPGMARGGPPMGGCSWWNLTITKTVQCYVYMVCGGFGCRRGWEGHASMP